jgi:hypothetical protein
MLVKIARGRSRTFCLRLRTAVLSSVELHEHVSKIRKAEGMLPKPMNGSLGFRDRSGALVRFTFRNSNRLPDVVPPHEDLVNSQA